MGSAPYIQGQEIDSNDAGVIGMGLDVDGKLQVHPILDPAIPTDLLIRQTESLENIELLLKTLLRHMEEITNDTFDDN